MTDTRKQKAKKNHLKKIRNADQALTVRGERADRIVSSPSWQSSINYNSSMPKDLKLSQIGSSPLPPPFRRLHSPRVRKHCQIIFACYFRKSSNKSFTFFRARGIAQPIKDKWISSPSHFRRFSPFNCSLSVVLQLDKWEYPENWHVVFCPTTIALF